MTEYEYKYLLMKDGKDFTTKDVLTKLYPSLDALCRDMINGTPIHQGYLPAEKASEIMKAIDLTLDFKPVEARLRNKGGELTFTLKGDGGFSRDETEVEIPYELFNKYWPWTKGHRVEKIRLKKEFGKYDIEIDFYTDRSLIVAEVEVPNSEVGKDVLAIGADITTDEFYKNKNLAR